MTTPTSVRLPRFKVFVDYWNFQLLVNNVHRTDKTNIDWKGLGTFLTKYAAQSAQIQEFTYEGINIYTSYNPKKDANTYYKWVNNWLNKQPGVQVSCLERQTKLPPKCPTCHKSIDKCPFCKAEMIGSIEKGVDALIVTDMIRLAWEDAYDFAVLASCDRDLIPGVKFIDAKGKKVIHAGFPPIGTEIAQSSWASFDITPHLQEIIRSAPHKKS